MSRFITQRGAISGYQWWQGGASVLGVLIASMIVDNSFGADPAWRYVTYLTVGYMISRGLAKAGSRYS